MKRVFLVLLVMEVFISCGEKKHIPDVSGIKVTLPVLRFDKDFFAIDTNNTDQALNTLHEKYGSFVNDFLYNILGVSPQPDSAVHGVNDYIRNYRFIYDSVQLHYASMEPTEKEIRKSLQLVQYYFPDYALPVNLIIFVGPIEGYANVLTQTGMAVGLQLYLGKDFSIYKTEYISQVYPAYRSRRFEAACIPVNCISIIIDEIYPPSNDNLPLVYQMIEAGKKLYLTDLFLPETADSLKTGYTQSQLEGCYKNEAFIWNYFLQNNLLYSTDISLTRAYMNDGPFTEVLGQASPGLIGQFIGWQIIKRWQESHPDVAPSQLINISAKQLYEEAKYKPD